VLALILQDGATVQQIGGVSTMGTTISTQNTTNTLYGVTWNSIYQNYTFQQLLLLEVKNLADYNYNTNVQVSAGTGLYSYSSTQYNLTTSGFSDVFVGSVSTNGSTVTSASYYNKSTGAQMIAYGSLHYSALPYQSTLTSGSLSQIVEIYPVNSAGNSTINNFLGSISYQGGGVYSGTITTALTGYYNPTTQKGVVLLINGNMPFSVSILTDAATVSNGGSISAGGLYAISGPLTNLTYTDWAQVSGDPSVSAYTTPLSNLLITGGGATYNLTGSLGNAITPYGSGDTFNIQSPNNKITALGSGNIAVFNTASNKFSITASGSNWSVVDTTGALGTTSLTNLQRLQFTDSMVALDNGPTQNAGSVYMLYQATFNRTPDAGGLGYWINAVDKGANIITNVASFFVTSPEFVAKYGANPTNASYVDNLYQNVLHRSGDAGGIAYWNQQLNSGAVTKAYVLEQFATLAEGAANVAPTIAHGIAYTQWVG